MSHSERKRGRRFLAELAVSVIQCFGFRWGGGTHQHYICCCLNVTLFATIHFPLHPGFMGLYSNHDDDG